MYLQDAQLREALKVRDEQTRQVVSFQVSVIKKEEAP